MELIPVRIAPLKAPNDDLLAAIERSNLKLKEGDVLAISSKVVSIHEGRAVPIEGTDKEELVEREADWYVRVRNGNYRPRFTVAKGHMAGAAGIDMSNGNGHYILYPEDPFKSANRLRNALSKRYGIRKLAVLITDSASIPLRRGAIGFALAWDNFVPLKDYRKKKDLFGRPFKIEVANIADGLAAAAVVAMGEGDEGTPLVVIRDANVEFGNRKPKEPLITALEDDMFAPFLLSKKWKRGGQASRSGTASRSRRGMPRSPR